MKITFGMPEILLIYSLLIYPQAWALSLAALVLGIASRLFCYAQHREDKKSIANVEVIQQEIH